MSWQWEWRAEDNLRALCETESLGLSDCICQDGHRQPHNLCGFRQQRCVSCPHCLSCAVREAPWCSLWSLWDPAWGSPMWLVGVPEGKLWRDSGGQLNATAQKWRASFTARGLELVTWPHPTCGGQKVQSWLSNTGAAVVPDRMQEDSRVSGLGSEADIRGVHWERKDGIWARGSRQTKLLELFFSSKI